jgi:hypothetical protein
MANVPASIPAEPGQSRCGGSYTTEIRVTGTIPGTGFGEQYAASISPVMLQGTLPIPSAAIPRYESEAQMRAEIEAPNGLKDRLNGVLTKLELDAWAYTQQDKATLKELALRGRRLLADANLAMRPGGKGAESAQQDVKQAAQHLRCAEYWAWRLLLYRQALADYEPPFEPGLAPRPPVEPGLGLPPIEPQEPTPQPPAKKAAEKKVSPWLIAGGLAAVAGGVYYFFLRKK